MPLRWDIGLLACLPPYCPSLVPPFPTKGVVMIGFNLYGVPFRRPILAREIVYP